MKNNLEVFTLMKKNPESLIDRYYADQNNLVIIPKTKDESNALTTAAEDLYRYIDTFETLNTDLKNQASADLIHQLLIKIDNIIMNTPNINFTSFCQYFLVYNLSQSLYRVIEDEDRLPLLKDLIIGYIENRHHIYKSHGYTPIVMQTMCDNYSHKRKNKTGAIKITTQLHEIGITNVITHIDEDDTLDMYYLIPDMFNKTLIQEIFEKNNISINSVRLSQLPNVIIKIKKDYFLIEHQTMKETGGGKEKKAKEKLDYIKQKTTNPNLHFITYIDGPLPNAIFSQNKVIQRIRAKEFRRILKTKPQNYLMNTYAFAEFFKDLIKETK